MKKLTGRFSSEPNNTDYDGFGGTSMITGQHYNMPYPLLFLYFRSLIRFGFNLADFFYNPCNIFFNAPFFDPQIS